MKEMKDGQITENVVENDEIQSILYSINNENMFHYDIVTCESSS